MPKDIILLSAMLFAFLTGCAKDGCLSEQETGAGVTILTAGIGTRTVLADDAQVLWTDGDRIKVNGLSSLSLKLSEPSKSVSFMFEGILSRPYKAVFPASIYKDAQTVTLPSVQTYKEGGFAEKAAPMCAYQTEGTNLNFRHLCSVIRLEINRADASDQAAIVRVQFRGNDSEQVCGDFTIDHQNGTLSGISTSQSDKTLRYEVPSTLNRQTGPMYVVVPSADYQKGYTFRITDAHGHYMDISKKSPQELEPGVIYQMPAFDFVPSGTILDGTIEQKTNVMGVVRDDAGEPIAGVVVSDGLNCVRTGTDGRFALQSDLSAVDFVFISTPSGYSPPVRNGLPIFYRKFSEGQLADGTYNFDFVLERMTSDPDRYTLLIAADPQPRSRGAGYDNIGYHSLDCCEDLYRDMREYASTIMTDRSCYGIVLGDIVHENMSLFDTYIINGMSRMGFPTFNVIGNHDNDRTAPDDKSGARTFEEKFGPANYSFNIGQLHYVVLDNLIMSDDGTSLTGEYKQGLRDDIWQWLKADLSFVDKDTPVMVCAHSPMFMQQNGSERSRYAEHGKDYASLLSAYDKVYAWAGHTHSMFHYIYDMSSSLRNIEVHTLSRSTGELWTNEYLSNGTPRGYLVVDVDGRYLSWKFRPLPYQTAKPVSGTPSYSLRAWNYDNNGVALMKSDGSGLDEAYQMNVFPRRQYGDGYVYADIFMWDEYWSDPVYISSDGSRTRMMLVTEGNCRYDAAQKEIFDYYKVNSSRLSADDSYSWSFDTARRLFRTASTKSSDNGKVEVTDRFGNVYTTPVSW